MRYEQVLDFWFKELETSQWFKKDTKIDSLIHDKFYNLYNDITCGKYQDWKNNPKSLLALVIVLDQFSRNMFRDNERMYTFDRMALNLAKFGIDNNLDDELENIEKSFLYMPFMHSEDIEDQKTCIDLFEKLVKKDNNFSMNLSYAKDHMRIIEMFGRYPHRNEILGRKSTPEEIDFLTLSNSSF